MKRFLTVSAILLCALIGTARGAQFGELSWNQSNIKTLRSFDKAAIFRFITGGNPGLGFTEKNIWEYGWYDLAGDGKYELALTFSTGPCCVFLSIYSMRGAGKVNVQTFDGAGQLSDTIRDLNGDGKDELILSKLVVENTGQLKFYWPAVYRLHKGKYVEASRDFPNYYDDEILPELARRIDETRAKVAAGKRNFEDTLAGLIMERDQILRVLGRNATAGLNHAYQWLNSDDPYLLQDAVVTFKDVGGHEAEMRAADEKRLRVYCARDPGASMCKQPAARGPAAAGR